MASSWGREITAIFRKELASELRTKTGLMTSGLFSIVSVVAVAFATINKRTDPTTAAALFWIVLLFSSIVSLPRTFTIEEELGTGDLLRLMARPHAVFWGKMLFNLGLLILTAVILSTLFFLFARVSVASPWLFVGSMMGACASLAGGVTLAGALVAQASNRGALAGAIAIPLLLPLTVVGIAALRVAFGEPGATVGARDALGLGCYGAISMAIGPYLYAAVWKS